MSNASTVKTQLNNLISLSNNTTDKTDTNITSAINSLIDGYGKTDGTPVYHYEITLSEETQYLEHNANCNKYAFIAIMEEVPTENVATEGVAYMIGIYDVNGLDAIPGETTSRTSVFGRVTYLPATSKYQNTIEANKWASKDKLFCNRTFFKTKYKLTLWDLSNEKLVN